MKIFRSFQILKRLHDRETLQVMCEKEPDYYGNTFNFNYLENNSLPRPLIAKTFKHGWIPDKMAKIPKQIVHWGGTDDLHVCFNKHQKKILQDHGFENVIAGGAPFLYADKALQSRRFQRKKESLLIMPAHTLSHIGKPTFYSDFLELCLEEVRTKFKETAMCIHQESFCPETLAFSKANQIKLIRGARYDDSFSLLNQVRLFRTYEYMITNSMGSHVIYALYSGCKVKVSHLEMTTLDQYFKHEWYRENPEVAETNFEWSQRLPKLYPYLIDNWACPESIQNEINDEIGFSSFQDLVSGKNVGKLFSSNAKEIFRWNLKNKQAYENYLLKLSTFCNEALK